MSYSEAAIVANLTAEDGSKARAARQDKDKRDFAEVMDRWLAYHEKERQQMAQLWESVPKDSLVDFLRMCAKSALLKIDDADEYSCSGRSHWSSITNRFANIVEQNWELLHRVCTVSPQEIKKAIELRDELSRLDELKRQWRKSVADELQSARKKKNKVSREYVELRQQLNAAAFDFRKYTEGAVTKHGFDPVPKPSIVFDGEGTGLPSQSGVYFAWQNDVVQYVGQSINLNSRCKHHHHKLQQGDVLSYVLVAEEQLNFAEAFYIGILKPTRNFGKRYGGRHERPHYDPRQRPPASRQRAQRGAQSGQAVVLGLAGRRRACRRAVG